MTMQVIAHQEVGANGAASITFSSIPQTYTDLYLVASTRSSGSGTDVLISYNGLTSSRSFKMLYGQGASAVTESSSTQMRLAQVNGTSSTSNVFTNSQLYIPNYTSSNYKSSSVDSVSENNDTTAFQTLLANLWSNTAAITSITLTMADSSNFVQYSSATLYGITAGSDGTTTVS